MVEIAWLNMLWFNCRAESLELVHLVYLVGALTSEISRWNHRKFLGLIQNNSSERKAIHLFSFVYFSGVNLSICIHLSISPKPPCQPSEDASQSTTTWKLQIAQFLRWRGWKASGVNFLGFFRLRLKTTRMKVPTCSTELIYSKKFIRPMYGMKP